MGKKESLKKEKRAALFSGRFSSKIFGILKFILGVCLLPFVYSVSAAFISESGLLAAPLQGYFWSGVITLLVIYLFIWEPAIIYARGQKILELIFNFFQPLVRVAPYLLPIYTVLLVILYGVLTYLLKFHNITNIFVFLFGFSLALHLVFSAKTLRAKQGDFLKSNYIFGFSFVYIINLALLSFCLSLIFKEFSFVNFSNNSLQIASGIFYAVFKQFFLR